MRKRFPVLAVVCITVFAVAAMAVVPALALLDAQIPVDALFGEVREWTPPVVPEAPLAAAPAVDVRSPRPPPLARHF